MATAAAARVVDDKENENVTEQPQPVQTEISKINGYDIFIITFHPPSLPALNRCADPPVGMHQKKAFQNWCEYNDIFSS